MTAAYPPDQHLLRDLRFSFDHDGDGTSSRAWMPVVEELCTDTGRARAGALATLVDVIGGGLAATAAAPGWIATADLTLSVVRCARPGSVVEARAQVLRAGRTTVVIEVALVDDREEDVGIATMSFAVLPRRDSNPEVDRMRDSPSTMAMPHSRLARPLLDELGVEVRDAARGVVDVPVIDWSRNSMGAMQGGVVATVADVAAEAALRSATGEPVVVTELYVTYLGFGRIGPVRSTVDILAAAAARGTARVELVDAGAENRRMTVVYAVATRDLP
ncbi:MAG TPA: PaaI family thioesterase [Acidimicrobiia bacterium]|nr:PaaI family thioesterase [Acidimicrobiia bacterium]